jgi:hypothetical protein
MKGGGKGFSNGWKALPWEALFFILLQFTLFLARQARKQSSGGAARSEQGLVTATFCSIV